MSSSYSKKITKIEIKPNYIVIDFTNPPNVIKYVRKVIHSKSGDRDLLTLAIIKDPNGDTKTVATSLWKPINSKSGRKLVRYYLRKYPKKVHGRFLNESSIVLFLTGGGGYV